MNNLEFDKRIIDLTIEAEENCRDEFEKINKLCELNSMKVLKAFNNNHVS